MEERGFTLKPIRLGLLARTVRERLASQQGVKNRGGRKATRVGWPC